MHSQSQFTPCLGTTANSLRGVNLEQLQTPLKTLENLNHSPKFQTLKGQRIGLNATALANETII